MAEEIERVNYYQLEYLGADDFKAEQAYHRDMRRRHNVGHHRWGIVVGLELVEEPKDSGTGIDMFVEAGFAVDGFGREIVVGARTKLDAADFASFKDVATHKIWIAYREQTDTPPAYGYTVCEGEEQNKRIHENFRIVIDPKRERDDIVVDGRTDAVPPPDDLSVPYQELPENARALWLVRLGTVKWDGGKGEFVSMTPEAYDDERVYAGIIAAEVLSPIETLTLRRRRSTALDDQPFAEVVGELQVDGHVKAKKNIYLHGGRVSWQTSGGIDDGVPLWMQRIAIADGYDLRVHIGKDSGAHKNAQRLSVGPGSAEDNPTSLTEKTVFAVKADDTVDIPTGRLNFGEKVRQMLNLWKSEYGIGVQAGTLYYRTSGEFAWYRGGTHSDTQFDSGGGSTVMRTNGNVLMVPGGIETQGDVYVDGGKVQLRLADGGTDTDELSITRFRAGPDRNDLRVIIGDNLDGQDAFSVGPVSFVDGQFKEAFRVTNVGDAKVTRNLAIDGNVTTDVRMLAGNAITYGSARFPVDVLAGETFLLVTNTTFDTTLTLSSRLPSVSSAFLQVALAGISNDNQAIDAGWHVRVLSDHRIGPNTWQFVVRITVTDSDGHLNSYSWSAFFIA